MTSRVTWTLAAGALATVMALVRVAGLTPAPGAQTRRETAPIGRMPWGDPDVQGEWTSEGEYGVPFERPTQFGTRQFLNEAEYAQRLEEVRIRDEQDLARVDVLSGKVTGPNAPIPHWREYNTTSR